MNDELNPKPMKWKALLIRVAVVVFLSLLLTAPGRKGEFCPQTLEMRTRSARVLRGTEYFIYLGKTDFQTPKISEFLIEHGYWRKTEKPTTWIPHILCLRRGVTVMLIGIGAL